METVPLHEQLMIQRKVSILTGIIAILLGLISILITGFSFWFLPWFPLLNYILGVLFFIIGFFLLGGWRLIR